MADFIIKDEAYELLKKIIIGLIIINFGSAIFVYFTGGSLAINCKDQQSCPLRKLNATQTSISITGNALSESFSVELFSTNSTKGDLPNLFTVPINFIWKTLNFIYNIMKLLGLSIYIIIFILFGLIPSLFITSGLNYFNYIFVTIYGFTVIIISGYALTLLWNRIAPIISGIYK